MRNFNIPATLHIGGQQIDVKEVDRCNNNVLGRCNLAGGIIEIARIFNSDGEISVSDSSKQNTFVHEVLHAILDTMGETELNNNEKFVCGCAGYLTEVIQQIVEDNVRAAYLSAVFDSKKCNTCSDE